MRRGSTLGRFARGLLVVLTALAAGAAPARAEDAAPRPVWMTPIEGLPPDARSREAFLGALRAAFAERMLPTLANGVSGAVPHGFVLADSGTAGSWRLQIVIGAPPLLRETVRARNGRTLSHKPTGLRASRGLTLVVAALSPEAAEAGARPVPERVGLALPEAVGDRAQLEVTRGVEYRWDLAGVAVGRVALETLMRAAGDADEGDWAADLAPVRRVASNRP